MAARDAPKPQSAWWLLALCGFGMATVGVIVWLAVTASAYPGFSYDPSVKPYVIALSIAPAAMLPGAACAPATSSIFGYSSLLPVIEYSPPDS